jgi:hypothetical protein
MVTDFDGTQVDVYGSRILASNGQVHADVMKSASLCCKVMGSGIASGNSAAGGSLEDPMSDRPRKSTRLTVSLEEQDYGALADLAVARRVAFMLIRQAVRQFIERAQSGENKGEEILHARTSKQD